MKFPFMLILVLISCVVIVAAEYSDAFTRKYFPTIFAATQANDTAQCLKLIFDDFEVSQHLVIPCDDTDGVNTCASLIFVAHDVKAIVIAYRGTKGMTQFLVETNVLTFVEPVEWPLGGKVGAYFAQAFEELWDSGVQTSVEEYLEAYPEYEVWIGGHSLGGSLSTLTAHKLIASNMVDSKRMKLITFGEPRTGNRKFAKIHDSLIDYSYRVVNKRDIVTHLPPKGYQGARHQGKEIWYKRGMSINSSYIECDEPESKKCSDSLKLFYRYEDHHRYFGVYMAMWGRRNCQGDPAEGKENSVD